MKLNVTIPVYNEERRLEAGIRRLAPFLTETFQRDYELVIADNASTDRTPQIARSLAEEFPPVRVVRLEAKGRGGALRHVWSQGGAEVCSYMDVDLATDLGAFPSLVRAVASGAADIAVASRLAPGAQTRRGWRREALSRGYNGLLRLALDAGVRDAQCGCKVVSRAVVDGVLPFVENNHWFFDTELLVLARQAGLNIREQPVRWDENTDSRVRLLPTIAEDLRGMARLRGRLNKRLAEEIRRAAEAGRRDTEPLKEALA